MKNIWEKTKEEKTQQIRKYNDDYDSELKWNKWEIVTLKLCI